MYIGYKPDLKFYSLLCTVTKVLEYASYSISDINCELIQITPVWRKTFYYSIWVMCEVSKFEDENQASLQFI